MNSGVRTLVTLALGATLALPAGAQGDACTSARLTVDGSAVTAKFCIPGGVPGSSVNVRESFASAGKTVVRSFALPVVPGAEVSRSIDDVDLGPLGIKRSLHMTLALRAGTVTLEHALALPGATPVK